MPHAQTTDFIFRRNGRVYVNRRGRQFSRLLAAEVCASAVVMLDKPCSEVVWRVLATHSIRQFPLHFPYGEHRVALHFNWTLQTLWRHSLLSECDDVPRSRRGQFYSHTKTSLSVSPTSGSTAMQVSGTAQLLGGALCARCCAVVCWTELNWQTDIRVSEFAVSGSTGRNWLASFSEPQPSLCVAWRASGLCRVSHTSVWKYGKCEQKFHLCSSVQ